MDKNLDSSQTISSDTERNRYLMFLWQHLWLIISLFIMTAGVALAVRSQLGSSVISTIPFVMSLAGMDGMAPEYTIGEYTYVMNFILVFLQFIILRRRFEKIQLLQILVGFFFGFLLDVNMWLTENIVCSSIWSRSAVQFIGCTILALGIALEIRCGSITMPGEGLPAAITKVSRIPFPKAKIIVDCSLVTIAVILGFLFFGRWLWNVVGFGTLFAMVYVGAMVKMISPRIGWFDNILGYRIGFPQHLFGLARFLHKHNCKSDE